MGFLWSTKRHVVFITVLIAYVLRSYFDTRVRVFSLLVPNSTSVLRYA